MKILNQQIFENKEAAALPGLMESGGLPALVSGLSGIHRVNLAAALYENLELPIFVVCPDDSAAESFSARAPGPGASAYIRRIRSKPCALSTSSNFISHSIISEERLFVKKNP